MGAVLAAGPRLVETSAQERGEALIMHDLGDVRQERDRSSHRRRAECGLDFQQIRPPADVRDSQSLEGEDPVELVGEAGGVVRAIGVGAGQPGEGAPGR